MSQAPKDGDRLSSVSNVQSWLILALVLVVVSFGRISNLTMSRDHLILANDHQYLLTTVAVTVIPIIIAHLFPRVRLWKQFLGAATVAGLLSACVQRDAWLAGVALVATPYQFLLIYPVFSDTRSARLDVKLSPLRPLGSSALFLFWAVAVPMVLYSTQGFHQLCGVALGLALVLLVVYVGGAYKAKNSVKKELMSLLLRTLHLPFAFLLGEAILGLAVIGASA